MDWFALGEYDEKIADIAENLNADVGAVYDIIDEKISPLQKRIQAEFQQTEEYLTKTKHDAIIARYRKEKAQFSKKFRCPENEYDYCFNLFGELMNESHYKKIAEDSKARSSYHELLMQELQN